jgi:hypothetical protein
VALPAEIPRATVWLVGLFVPLAFDHGYIPSLMLSNEEVEPGDEDEELLFSTELLDDDRLEVDHADEDDHSASSQLPSRFTGSILTMVLSKLHFLK